MMYREYFFKLNYKRLNSFMLRLMYLSLLSTYVNEAGKVSTWLEIISDLVTSE